jgi:hypothetical protein
MITRENVETHIARLENDLKYKEALELVRRFRPKDIVVTKKTLKSVYRLKNNEIESMTFIEVKNPYYSCAGPMKLYLKSEAMQWIEKIKEYKTPICHHNYIY